jgi:hypothetical protein
MKKQWFALLLVLLLGGAAAETSDPKSPLVQAGKKSLYQRVLTIPGSKLAASPQASKKGKSIPPFSAYYVYARKQADGQEWLQVGTDRFGTLDGWLPAKDTLEWNKGLTVAFRDPVEHDRTLLFRNQTALKELAESGDLDRYNRFYVAAEKGLSLENSPVVAIQPPGHIDIQEDFYLVPIHQHEDIYIGTERARMLQVSSVPLRIADAGKNPKQTVRAADTGYSAGLVFAIDSTLSMDPYIHRTREAVRKIYDRLESAGLVGNVNFGLVAFRDNVNAAPGINYLTRTYVNLQEGRDSGTFLSKVDRLTAASASSQDFVEDAYAGVKRAIETMNWKGQDARYVVLITDAGPRDEKDPLSGTGMSAEGLRQLALDNDIAIFVLHLLTPATMANQEMAEKQYRQLSDFPGIGSLYYGVPTGNVQEFGHVLDTVAGQITTQVKTAAAASGSPPPQRPPVQQASGAEDTQLARLQEKVAKLGYALRMRYLQKHKDDQIPNVFNAWLLDRDFRRPEQRTLDIRVLLTRDQLSDLHDILKQVLSTAEEGLLSPQNFLNELQSLAATISRDPEQLGTTTAITAGRGNSLADLGFMREYIEDLPYTADVMNVSLDDWQSWSAAEQIRFLNNLEAKISYYRALHDQTDLWVSLDGGPIDGDSVFPIALEMLP